MTTTAAERVCPEDRSRSVGDVFVEEKKLLTPLPEDAFPTDEREEVEVGKTPYVRFDLNDYSVPHTHVRRTLVVVASLDTVRILDGLDTIATHARSWSRGEQTENPDHIAALAESKVQARRARTTDRLVATVPHSRALLALLAERGEHGNYLGHAVRQLVQLLQSHQPDELDRAIAEAVERGTPQVSAVRQVLDKQRQARGEPPPTTLPAVRDPRVAGLVVRPHSLDSYDGLGTKESSDEEENRQR
jgi:hypothetical protein